MKKNNYKYRFKILQSLGKPPYNANKHFQKKILLAHQSKLPTNQGERDAYRKGKEPSMFDYMTARPGHPTKSTPALGGGDGNTSVAAL